MEDSSLIVGLGNPGKEYADTRHNIGFMIIERLAKYLNFGWELNKKFTAELAKGNIDGRNILLTKPQCYMNLSGKTVFPLAGYYKIHTKQIMVVMDDLDLPLGTLRMRPNGGNGGHRGIESISDCLGTSDFPRLRIGIGRPNLKHDISDFVLGKFDEKEMGKLENVLETASNQLNCWINEGLQTAMNNYNGDLTPNNEEKKDDEIRRNNNS
ncbi:MAG: aminoacyl-tRNA hydrolase [Verrucomicrobiota bacterium]|nr:aminoacyl-tRNA hydrolase [Verrucomicrobiota bacterium]